ncbi:hypothetical protein [Domibacillus mangrovi]|uniref:Uncharacterized protein n=1 Tax=Domibacillus mangrovi TaxID=1714354 RepID=A0A1Q5P6R2_9BACI|nr:hypothetical protein [Domibacillus mangrovi]OKL37831.1 hypothetical protein BLL40_03115 [Domibacillus mangrovi]
MQIFEKGKWTNVKVVPCVTEEEFETFVLFFFRNWSAFGDGFTVMEIIGMLYMMLTQTKTLLL